MVRAAAVEPTLAPRKRERKMKSRIMMAEGTAEFRAE